MVNITIDNQKISVPSGTTIMEAAAKLFHCQIRSTSFRSVLLWNLRLPSLHHWLL